MKQFLKMASVSFGLLAMTMCLMMVSPVLAESLEVNGDNIEYSVDKKKVIVTGHVEIKQLDTVLTSDYAEYTQATNTAYARGNVVITSPEKRVVTDEITYDFNRKNVTSAPTKVYAPPVYASGKSVTTADDGSYIVKTGRFTMSDYDDPEYHFSASRLKLNSEKNRLTARNLRLSIADIPVFYLPFYVKNLENTHTPGHHKFGKESNWGHYVFNRWDYDFNEYLQGSLALDYRELKGWTEGADVHYNTPEAGSGMIRGRYMNEDQRNGTSRERYFAEWRHMYRPDDKTQVLTQVFDLTDDSFLADYFYRFDGDPIPPSYVAATRHLDYGSLNGVVTPRVGDFSSQTEYLPQVRYDLPYVNLADTGFYWKNITDVAYLDHREGGIAHADKDNARLDVNQELSYPFDLGILNLTPFLGSEHTYYNKTLDPSEDDAVRNIVKSGMSASTKFFKTYSDARMNFFGEKFESVRHIITPEVKYEYVPDPTIDAGNLYPFDDIDRQDSKQALYFSLQNRFQTKRVKKVKYRNIEEEYGTQGLLSYETYESYDDFANGRFVEEKDVIDFFRVSVGSSYNLDKTNGLNYGFQTVDVSMEFTPLDWMMATASAGYDPKRGTVTTFNTDLTLRYGHWSFGTGYRYHAFADDLLTTSIAYTPDRKWSFRIYERVDLQAPTWEEEEYAITRDFHAWALDLRYNRSLARGDESWIVFRFKEMGGVSKAERETDPDEERNKYYPKEVGVIDKNDVY